MKAFLIVEDDENFAETLAQEFADLGYAVRTARSVKELETLNDYTPTHAVVDLKLKGESGLDCIKVIKERFPDCLSVVLTGYGSIATAVQAVKIGAVNYISKPASIEAIEQAFTTAADQEAEAEQRYNLYRHEREYIEKVIQDFGGNISQAAKALGIHRQSLQRKLRKFTT